MKTATQTTETTEQAVAQSTFHANRPQPHRFAAPQAHVKNLLAEVERLQKLVQTQDGTIATLAELANIDSLTGLTNRRGFENSLSAALSDYHRYNHRGALLLMDLNRFKQINDTYGHTVGDALLMHVARILRENTRESDIVARLGGDEFVIILREAPARAANEKALELRGMIADQPCHVGDLALHASLSIGVATFSEMSEPRALMSLADQRMYLAKKSFQA